MNSILAAIYKEDIYAGFEPLPFKCGGWEGEHPIFKKLIKEIRPRVIIEVGSWEGMSAIEMARQSAMLGDSPAIICIDTWLGSADHIMNWGERLERKNGLPSLYWRFISNVIHRQAQDCIVPLPCDSITGAEVLSGLGIMADLIYIDGSHRYETVSQEVRLYRSLLSDGRGLMFGHDYDGDVMMAVDEEFDNVDIIGRFWIGRH